MEWLNCDVAVLPAVAHNVGKQKARQIKAEFVEAHERHMKCGKGAECHHKLPEALGFLAMSFLPSSHA